MENLLHNHLKCGTSLCALKDKESNCKTAYKTALVLKQLQTKQIAIFLDRIKTRPLYYESDNDTNCYEQLYLWR